VHAIHAPLSQTLLLPHGAPFVTGMRVSMHVGGAVLQS
jgi:hypothetical protein